MNSNNTTDTGEKGNNGKNKEAKDASGKISIVEAKRLKAMQLQANAANSTGAEASAAQEKKKHKPHKSNVENRANVRDNRDKKDRRENKSNRDNRDSRGNKYVKGNIGREGRDGKYNKNGKDNKNNKEKKYNKAVAEDRDARDNRDNKYSKINTENGGVKESTAGIAGAYNGAGTADIAGIGKLSLPQFRRRDGKFDRVKTKLSSGTLTATGDSSDNFNFGIGLHGENLEVESNTDEVGEIDAAGTVPDIHEPSAQQLGTKETEGSREEEIEIVGVRYKPVGKIYFFGPDGVQYEVNDKVIVETSRGIELGYIVIKNKMIEISKIVQPLKHIQRRATDDDVEKVKENKKLAKQAIGIAEERVKAHGLKLKIIEAEYTFDNSKLLYYFTAENRIDFRELVKDLASIFRIRIELRQIGIRDQTKIVGGLSICGRPFCCNSFLQDFEQVTIKMAKEQNISINSAKISGACGKLMCCLRYEHETYESLYKDMPRVNSIVETSSGETGVVIESNVLTGVCKVKINARGNEQIVSAIKPYSKKELKTIGFVKGEQAHYTD